MTLPSPDAPARPLRILHVDAERGFSGGEVQVLLLVEGLRARGHAVALALPPGAALAGTARSRGFEVHPVPMRNDLDLRAVARLRGLLRRGEFDLAHLHTGRATWLGALAAAWAGVPAVTTRRMDRRVRRGWRTRWIYRRGTRRAAAISPAVRDALLAAGVPPERVRLVPSAVDPARVRASEATDAGRAVRASLGLPPASDAGPGACLLLVLAALVPRKGIDLLLEALARLPEPRPLLAVAGDGAARPALEALARERGLEARVRFLGRREDVPALLAAADVLVLSSRKEGLGVAALEGMAAGLSVVATRVGGLGEAVVDGRTGLLVPPGDVGALAAALSRLAGDPAERLRLGAAGPARVAEGHLAEQMTASYEALYREVLAEARAAPRGAPGDPPERG